MANKLLSDLLKGTYAGGTSYTVGDIVSYNGSGYVCKVNSLGNLPTNTTYWALLASKGDTGATGGAGSTGATGNTGPAGTSFTWRDTYNAGTAYSVNDNVSYNGSSYICILASTGNLPTNTTYWSLLALKGTDGSGTGDFSSNTSSSVDSEVVLFSGTGGKTGKRASGSGIATLTSGVLSVTATTGSGSVVLATSPSLVTPVLGVAGATRVGIGEAADATIPLVVTGSNPTVRYSGGVPGVAFKTTQGSAREWKLVSAFNDADSISLVDVTNTNAQAIRINGNGGAIENNQKTFFSKVAYFAETDNGNSSTADTIDWGASNKQKSTLTGNCTFTFTAPSGPCSLVLKLLQDATGSRLVTWPATVKWPNNVIPTLSTTASKMDLICFYYDGTNYYGTSSLTYTP